MSRLEITDLPFCETISDIEAQGGLFYYTNLKDFFWQSLTIYHADIPVFKPYSSVKKKGFLLEEFRDDSGDNYR